jgi:hypothetical protein
MRLLQLLGSLPLLSERPQRVHCVQADHVRGWDVIPGTNGQSATSSRGFQTRLLEDKKSEEEEDPYLRRRFPFVT